MGNDRRIDLEPRAERYDQGFSQGYAQAERDVANMLQRLGHIAASVLVTNEEHRRTHTTNGVTP